VNTWREPWAIDTDTFTLSFPTRGTSTKVSAAETLGWLRHTPSTQAVTVAGAIDDSTPGLIVRLTPL
jgi:hypothetical protein